MKNKKTWGGQWTEEKLDAFEKYVKAYLTIMNAYRSKYGWELVYFDGFAGSGTRTQEEENQEIEEVVDLFGQQITAEDLKVYKGAAERVVKIESDGTRSFDYYCFVDNSKKNCDALQNKLDQYHTTGGKYYLPEDANIAVRKLATNLRIRKTRKALAFLDPFGMQIDWSSIEMLKGLSVDLWILVPTGVVINRLLKRRINSQEGLAHAEKLTRFFGMTEDEIRSFFYKEEQDSTLFDDESLITKKEDAIRKIAQLYIDRLHDIFPYVTDTPKVLYNSNNVPIYHLVFASQKYTAMSIAQDIIDKK